MLAREEGVHVFVFFLLLVFFFSFAQTDTFHLQVCRSAVLQDIALGVTSCWFTLHSVFIYSL